MGRGRKFDDEFKREALRLVKTGGRKVSEIAKDLGINISTLHTWKSKSVEMPSGEIVTNSEITTGTASYYPFISSQLPADVSPYLVILIISLMILFEKPKYAYALL